MSDFRPGFLNEPRGGAGANGRGQAPRERRNFLQRFWQDTVMRPDKVESNMTIAWAVFVFAGGIVATRTLAKDLIVPAF